MPSKQFTLSAVARPQNCRSKGYWKVSASYQVAPQLKGAVEGRRKQFPLGEKNKEAQASQPAGKEGGDTAGPELLGCTEGAAGSPASPKQRQTRTLPAPGSWFERAERSMSRKLTPLQPWEPHGLSPSPILAPPSRSFPAVPDPPRPAPEHAALPARSRRDQRSDATCHPPAATLHLSRRRAAFVHQRPIRARGAPGHAPCRRRWGGGPAPPRSRGRGFEPRRRQRDTGGQAGARTPRVWGIPPSRPSGRAGGAGDSSQLPGTGGAAVRPERQCGICSREGTR